jgi:hypothetical protein
MSKSIFNLDEFKPYRSAWDVRLKELTYRASYYDGSIYGRTKEGVLWTMGPRVAKEIKPLFLPLSRSVDIDAGIIPGGWTFPPDDPKYQAWTDAKDTLFDMSAWDVNGVLFVHYGAMYGVSGLRVSSLPGVVMVQPANPTCFMIFDTFALWVETRDYEGECYEYAEVITAETIRTFKDGEPYGYDGREAEYPNELGFIPLTECTHINDGTPLGECTYQKSIPMLNEVNEMSTRLADIIRKNADPQWVASGAEPSDLQRGSDYMWFMPAGASVDAAVPTIDIAGVLEFIREIKEGVKESLPELSFDDIRKAGQIATATLEIQLMELIIKVKRTRPNYDRCLTTAMKMAGVAGIAMGVDALSPLYDPELILDANRPILPVLPKDKIDMEIAQIELDNMRAAQGNQEGTMQPNA